jgi:hypothetical protein
MTSKKSVTHQLGDRFSLPLPPPAHDAHETKVSVEQA